MSVAAISLCVYEMCERQLLFGFMSHLWLLKQGFCCFILKYCTWQPLVLVVVSSMIIFHGSSPGQHPGAGQTHWFSCDVDQPVYSHSNFSPETDSAFSNFLKLRSVSHPAFLLILAQDL